VLEPIHVSRIDMI